MWQRAGRTQGSFRRDFKPVLTSIRDTGAVLTSPAPVPSFGRRSSTRVLALPHLHWSWAGWKTAGALAVLCSGVAWASLPRVTDIPTDEQRQWQALGIAPLSSGGATGMRMAATDAAAPVEFVPKRAVSIAPVAAPTQLASIVTGPLRMTGRVGDGLYWSL